MGVNMYVKEGFSSMTKEYVSKEQVEYVFDRYVDDEKLKQLNFTLEKFGITKREYIIHFLAQIGHESNGLKWFAELADGSAYENRRDLGNTQPGDGKRFKGVGPIQVTGRANYQDFADFIKDPRVMEGWQYVIRHYAFAASGFWWYNNRINQAIDAGADVRRVSRLVNGKDPANGLEDRIRYYKRAEEVFKMPSTEKPIAFVYKANRDTFLKKRPIGSSLLEEKELHAVEKNRLFLVESAQSDPKTNHSRLVLSYGLGTWYVFNPHWDSRPYKKEEQISNPLPAKKSRQVPQYYPQRDSEVPGQAPRSCFSSSNAMLLKRLKPSSLSGVNADDEFLKVVRRFGDTTEWQAQIKALDHFGVKARLVQTGNLESIQKEINREYGTSLGYIHRGQLTNLVGDGHWIYCFDTDSPTPTSISLVVHDPWGRTNLETGITETPNGSNIRYDWDLFRRRWMVSPNGRGGWSYTPNKGWMIVVDSVS